MARSRAAFDVNDDGTFVIGGGIKSILARITTEAAAFFDVSPTSTLECEAVSHPGQWQFLG
jgi:hypothetical protein